MTNTNSNSDANIGNKIIAEAMSSEQAMNNRQSRMTLYMFENEITYSLEALSVFFKEAGGKRTEMIETAIKAMSDDYTKAVELREDLKELRRADKAAFNRTSKPHTLEATSNKIQAANKLFGLAAVSALHLRHVDAYDVKMNANGVIAFRAVNVDENGDPIKDSKGNVSSTKYEMSGRSLVSAGDKSLTALGIKAKKETTKTSNPANANKVAGVATVASVINNRVKKALATSATGALDELAEEETKELDSLLDTLMAAKFLDDKGNVDRKTVLEYLDLTFPNKEAKPAKESKAA